MKHEIIKWSWKKIVTKEGRGYINKLCEIINLLAPEIEIKTLSTIKDNSWLITFCLTSLVEEYSKSEKIRIKESWLDSAVFLYLHKFHYSLIRNSFVLTLREELEHEYSENIENAWLEFLDRINELVSKQLDSLLIDQKGRAHI